MQQPPPFVDIHCHLIPEIDDGASSWEDTLAMAEMAVADGIETVIVTPHQLGGFAHNRGDAVRAATAQLQEFLESNAVPLRVLPGADVRIEPDLVSMLRKGDVVSLADQRRYVLLELPHELYIPLERLIRELAGAGMVGILSHPERNQGILRDASVLRPLVEAGCLMQVTAGSLLGAFGPQVQKFSESLVEQRLVHFLATDAHGPKSRRPLMRQAFERAAELAGWQRAVEMCCHNPACVAQGRPIAKQSTQQQSQQSRGRSWSGWLGLRKAG